MKCTREAKLREFQICQKSYNRRKTSKKKNEKKRERKEILNMVKEEKTTKIRRTSRRLYP